MSNSWARQRWGIMSVGRCKRLVKTPATSNRAWLSSKARVSAKTSLCNFRIAAGTPKMGSLKCADKQQSANKRPSRGRLRRHSSDAFAPDIGHSAACVRRWLVDRSGRSQSSGDPPQALSKSKNTGGSDLSPLVFTVQTSCRRRIEQCIKTCARSHLAKLAVLRRIAGIVHRICHPGTEFLVPPDVRQDRAGVVIQCSLVAVTRGAQQCLRQNVYVIESEIHPLRACGR